MFRVCKEIIMTIYWSGAISEAASQLSHNYQTGEKWDFHARTNQASHSFEKIIVLEFL